MSYILAIDQGTTSCRALLVDRKGKIVGMAQKEFPQYFPRPGWVEHDANEIWSTQVSVIAEVLAHTHTPSNKIKGIGITNQRETTVLWERKTSRPIAPAIVWQDRRTTELCNELKQEQLEPIFHQKTGLLIDPYFSGTKIRWLLDHIRGARLLAKQGELCFGTIDSWLIWKLTGGKLHITDATNASRTLLYNLEKNDWDEEILKILQVPRSILPEVKSSSEIYGSTSLELFSPRVPIAGIAGDQQASLFGHGCITRGGGKVTYGTGCFILVNIGKEPLLSKNHLLTTVAYKTKEETYYAFEGSVFIGGALIQWLRDELKIIETAKDIEALASKVKDSAGLTFVPSFTGLGAPYWEPKARGTLFGITRGTNRCHIAYAALEGIAHQVTDIIDVMQQEKGLDIKQLRVDGGAVENALLMQIQADQLQIPLIRPKCKEMTALGVSFLAGLAVEFWKNKEELSSLWQEESQITPLLSKGINETKKKEWQKAVACIKVWSQYES
ncbi:MAG: glycerol kinase GlpK [Simkania negevensis]|nr:glycerol kinase GlpK [Simkania negevensis]